MHPALFCATMALRWSKMDQVKVGALIRALRPEKGLTQKQLAEKLLVGDKAVSKWERGVSRG